jgi:succinate dehydrogenase/fumarate reductase flavoprotein subunit
MAETCDIIIVGGGGSGLAAAVSAAECGAEVLVLEKEAELGGTTGIAVGSFTANRTSMQQQSGIEDSIDEHAEDASRFAPSYIEARNNDDLRRWFLGHGAETLTWLQGMGLSFHGPSPEPPNRVPRMHNVVPGARAYITTLQTCYRRLHGRVLCEARVVALTRGEGGTVSGVIAEIGGERRVFAARKGVVLAAGDYTHSTELIGRHLGVSYTEVEGINPKSTGDGHLLAEREGAKLLNMDVAYGPELRFVPPAGRTFQQWLPSTGLAARFLGRLLPWIPDALMGAMIRRLLVTWQHPENTLFDDGAILVNQQGERFCDERIWPDREIATARQLGKIGYILLDERLIERYSSWPHFISTAPKIAYAYVADYLKLRADVAVSADSVEAIASARALPAAALRESIRATNQQRQQDGRPPLDGRRWVLLGPAKAYFTTTEGGVAIDQQFRALDRHNEPIPGLYAIGQNGLGGQVLWGHGLHIAWAMTSGRLVGRQLAGSSL